MVKIEGKYGLLIDTTKCVGCEMCIKGCQEENGLPSGEETPKELSAEVYTVLQKQNGVYRRKFCFHCTDPACVSACPVNAMVKTSDGPVVNDGSKCIGCRYCMVACPHSIPRYEWEKTVPAVKKCIMCYKRLAEGKPTACAEACVFDATVFGLYGDMLTEAQRRIDENPDDYVHHIYGQAEAGGSQVIYLAAVPFASLGFNTDVPSKALPSLTGNVLSMFPNVLSVGGVILLGTWWIINRRMSLADEKALEAKLDAEIGSEEKP